MTRSFLVAFIFTLVSLPILASDDPAKERHELMEGVKDAAGVIGGMIKGEQEFEIKAAMEALFVWQNAAQKFGHLFPEGTYSGEPDTAKMDVWTDRKGFEELLAKFGSQVDDAIGATPQTQDELAEAAGPIFKTCKQCHEGYRLEGD